MPPYQWTTKIETLPFQLCKELLLPLFVCHFVREGRILGQHWSLRLSAVEVVEPVAEGVLRVQVNLEHMFVLHSVRIQTFLPITKQYSFSGKLFLITKYFFLGSSTFFTDFFTLNII